MDGLPRVTTIEAITKERDKLRAELWRLNEAVEYWQKQAKAAELQLKESHREIDVVKGVMKEQVMSLYAYEIEIKDLKLQKNAMSRRIVEAIKVVEQQTTPEWNLGAQRAAKRILEALKHGSTEGGNLPQMDEEGRVKTVCEKCGEEGRETNDLRTHVDHKSKACGAAPSAGSYIWCSFKPGHDGPCSWDEHDSTVKCSCTIERLGQYGNYRRRGDPRCPEHGSADLRTR